MAERVYQAARTSTLPEVQRSALLPPTVVIAGPTGIGKTALSLQLAHQFPVEIISADSRQVYREFDIGTAKVSKAERTLATHHLIDIVEPTDIFTVANFQALGRVALDEIGARQRIALIVGGTAHYVRALGEQFSVPAVAPDWEFRAGLEAVAQAAGPEVLHSRLAALDALAAERIPFANVRRVIRALEVIAHTGRPFSEQSRDRLNPSPALRLALTMNREQLYEIVDRRVDTMMDDGWLQEVQRLLAAGVSLTSPPMSSSGYRELAAALRGELTIDEAVQRAKFSVHAYIRRQYIWLRRMPEYEWVQVEPGYETIVAERLEGYLDSLVTELTR
ncbi:MAG: tRNA (adenosine(37)-N6)-dimethylallyltransferase MiaA [Chloroflexota bacterium]